MVLVAGVGLFRKADQRPVPGECGAIAADVNRGVFRSRCGLFRGEDNAEVRECIVEREKKRGDDVRFLAGQLIRRLEGTYVDV